MDEIEVGEVFTISDESEEEQSVEVQIGRAHV